MGKGMGFPVITLLGLLIFTGCLTDAQAKDNTRFFPACKVFDEIAMAAWIEEGSGDVATLHVSCLTLPKVRDDMIMYRCTGYQPILPNCPNKVDLIGGEMLAPSEYPSHHAIVLMLCCQRASHGGWTHSVHFDWPYQWQRLRDMDFVGVELTLITETMKKIKTRLILRNERYRGNALQSRPNDGNFLRDPSSDRAHIMENFKGLEWIGGAYREMPSCASMRDTSATLPRIHASQTNRPPHNEGSARDFFNAVIQAPSGQTNVIYYAGTSNHVSVLVHGTNAGLHFWNLPEEYLDKSICRGYSSDQSDWIVLKNDGESELRHWNGHKAIEDFITGLPLNSALVRPKSLWYEVPEMPQTSSDRVFLRQDFRIDETLCRDLYPGLRICTTELFAAPLNAVSTILSQMRNEGRRMAEKVSVDSEPQCFIIWTRGQLQISSVGDPPELAVFCVGDAIAAPVQLWWNMAYGDLIPFDEDAVVEAYGNRSLCVRGWKERKIE